MKKYFAQFTIIVTTLVLFLLPTLQNVHADEVYLKNGDRLSGKIIKQDENSILIETAAMGSITVNKKFVNKILTDKNIREAISKEEKAIQWKREISVGYNATRGNARTEQFSLSAFLNRNNKHIDEWTFKGDILYSSSNKKMDAQKWYGMGRYAFSLGPRKAWYHFYRLEADHDRFANVDYRFIPATGLGYWFFGLPKTKLITEIAVGLEHTDYRDETKNTSKMVLIPRLFYEQTIFKNATFSEDLYFYPTLINSGSYRIRSETAFTVSLNKILSLRLGFIDEYNSSPPNDTDKNDLYFISSLMYSF